MPVESVPFNFRIYHRETKHSNIGDESTRQYLYIQTSGQSTPEGRLGGGQILDAQLSGIISNPADVKPGLCHQASELNCSSGLNVEDSQSQTHTADTENVEVH